MREKIWAAIVETLDTHAAEANIDELLTDVVMQTIEASQPTRLPVKYIGRRPEYSDGLYNTGLWKKDQVKLVEVAVAKQMLNHPDVYVPGEKAQADEITDGIQPVGDNAPHLDAGREAVMAMGTKKAVAEFVANNFSGAKIDLPKTATVADYRLEAVRMIDKYHLPI